MRRKKGSGGEIKRIVIAAALLLAAALGLAAGCSALDNDDAVYMPNGNIVFVPDD